MKRKHSASILLIDDNAELLEVYTSRMNRRRPTYKITCTSDAKKASELAFRCLYDVIVIDCRIPYRGYEYGGLCLADELRPRYGADSILLCSKYITASFLQQHAADYDFVPKPTSGKQDVVKTICDNIDTLRSRQYIFVAMPFAEEFDGVYEKYLRAPIESSGFQAVRVDHLHHTRRIHEVLFELLEKAKGVVFFADNANPNAYYEAGFAEALKKEVIVVAKSVEALRFDINTKATVVYGEKISVLPKLIKEKLSGLRFNDVIGL